MKNNIECLMYLENAKNELVKEFPNNDNLTDTLFLKICDFVSEDWDGISENKIYRGFIGELIEIIEISFDNNASKSYLRNFFKKLSKDNFINYLSKLIPSKLDNIKRITHWLVTSFIYQNGLSSKERELEAIVNHLKNEM